MTEEKERCNCDASCGENRYHTKGDPGCMYFVGEDRGTSGPLSKSTFSQEEFDQRARRIQIADLREYWKALRYHDWQYNYSDDHHVWTKGHDMEGKLHKWSEKSPEHTELYNVFKTWSLSPGTSPIPPYPLRYLCDNARHMVCEPFTVANLHVMATALGLKKAWFHSSKFPHYDMPKKRIAELTAQCERVTQKQILQIIKAGAK
jgi:hypothetical protein